MLCLWTFWTFIAFVGVVYCLLVPWFSQDTTYNVHVVDVWNNDMTRVALHVVIASRDVQRATCSFVSPALHYIHWSWNLSHMRSCRGVSCCVLSTYIASPVMLLKTSRAWVANLKVWIQTDSNTGNQNLHHCRKRFWQQSASVTDKAQDIGLDEICKEHTPKCRRKAPGPNPDQREQLINHNMAPEQGSLEHPATLLHVWDNSIEQAWR